MRLHRLAAAALVLAVLGLQQALAAAAAGPGAPLDCINVRVAVVVYDVYGGLDAAAVTEPGWVSLNVTRHLAMLGAVGLCYNVTLEGFQATREESEELASRLSRLYEYPALVDWSDFEPPNGYARVRLSSAYNEIYESAVALLRSRGVDPSSFHDITVIIGDLDGVSRVYYEYAPAPFMPHGVLLMEGVRGWGGPAPMTFYDLSTVQKPWPDYEVPFYREGVLANPESEPPIWMLDDPNSYAAGLVVDHVKYHVVGDTVMVPATLWLNVTVAVVDFGDDGRVRELLGQVDAGVIERFTEALAPWIDVSVNVVVVKATQELADYYEEAPVDEDGYKVIDYYRVYGLLAGIAASVAGQPDWSSDSTSWAFLVLATPEPAYFTAGGRLNFTGFATAQFGATTYPGYRDRVYRSGLPFVVAHEIGHALGESHPFQFYGSIRWLMDLTGTVMSYYDPGRAALGGYYHYSALRLSHLQAIQYYQAARDAGVGEDVLERAERLLEEYRGPEALSLLLESLGYNVSVPAIYPGAGPPAPQQPVHPSLYLAILLLALLVILVAAVKLVL